MSYFLFLVEVVPFKGCYKPLSVTRSMRSRSITSMGTRVSIAKFTVSSDMKCLMEDDCNGYTYADDAKYPRLILMFNLMLIGFFLIKY